jgi:hypothetical protein
MQMKRDDIQMIGSPLGFSSIDSLLFVGFSGEWSDCGGRQKVEGECAWISAISHHTWEKGMAHLRMNECAGTALPAIQMGVGLLKWDLNRPAQAIEWCRGSCWKSGKSMWGGGFLQNWKSYKIEGWKGNVALATDIESDTRKTTSLEWSVEKGLVKRDGRW